MRYVFRADASQSIGSGHVMRSSAIAEELKARGEIVIFVGQISDLTWVHEKIAVLGFSYIYSNPRDFTSDPHSDVLVLDSYEIEVDDDFIDSENWLHVVAIVDELTPNYRCSMRIQPGLDSTWMGNSKVPVLAGPKYIPIRLALTNKVDRRKNNNDSLKIAVVAGGSDPYKLVNEIAKILFEFSESFEASLFSNSITDRIADSRFNYVEIGSKLDEVIQNVDLVLTTASTSSLEFIARGLCVGVARAVDNQEQCYKSLGQFDAAAQIGFRNSKNVWELNKDKIYLLVTSADLRQSLIANALGLVDFKGSKRIADAIMNL